MRLPFNFDNSDINQEARIKLIYTSPENHQNVEISMDAEEISIDGLLDAFQRFLGALGVCVPENVILGFIDANQQEEENGEEEKGTVKFTLEDDDEEDDDDEEEEDDEKD